MKTYQGLLSIGDHGESDDVLFLSGHDEPLAEELEWMDGQVVTVRYWVTNEECTRDQAVESFVLTCMGAAKAEFQACYSEYTGYLWTDEFLNVGGHDLLAELKSHAGKWLILEIEQ